MLRYLYAKSPLFLEIIREFINDIQFNDPSARVKIQCVGGKLRNLFDATVVGVSGDMIKLLCLVLVLRQSISLSVSWLC